MKLTLNRRIGSVHVNLEVAAEDDPHIDGLHKLVHRCVEATETTIGKLNEEFFDEWMSDQGNRLIHEALREGEVMDKKQRDSQEIRCAIEQERGRYLQRYRQLTLKHEWRLHDLEQEHLQKRWQLLDELEQAIQREKGGG